MEAGAAGDPFMQRRPSIYRRKHMGVIRLTTFLSSSAALKRQFALLSPSNSSRPCDYVTNPPTANGNLVVGPNTPVDIVVDASSLAHYLSSKVDYTYIGTYKALEKATFDFLTALGRASPPKSSAHLIFDGGVPPGKLGTRRSREVEKLVKVRGIVERWGVEGTMSKNTKSAKRKKKNTETRRGLKKEWCDRRGGVLPLLAVEAVQRAAQSWTNTNHRIKFDVFCNFATEDGDRICVGVARKLADKHGGRGVVVVVSNDSDFVVFEGIFYVPLSSLTFPASESPSDTQPFSLTASLHTSTILAQALTLPISRLPLLAALSGTDYTPPSVLPHRLLSHMKSRQHSGPIVPNLPDNIALAAGYIRSFHPDAPLKFILEDLERVCSLSEDGVAAMIGIRNALESYVPTNPLSTDLHPPSHIQSVLLHSRFLCVGSFEDVSRASCWSSSLISCGALPWAWSWSVIRWGDPGLIERYAKGQWVLAVELRKGKDRYAQVEGTPVALNSLVEIAREVGGYGGDNDVTKLSQWLAVMSDNTQREAVAAQCLDVPPSALGWSLPSHRGVAIGLAGFFTAYTRTVGSTPTAALNPVEAAALILVAGRWLSRLLLLVALHLPNYIVDAAMAWFDGIEAARAFDELEWWEEELMSEEWTWGRWVGQDTEQWALTVWNGLELDSL
ncbi:hypothetical protein HDU93_001440 [Gonapodya sp. JEL0774]|nr:hypothetical protein HDU93_001440 [Gonapodya sp. JEL0774]